MDNRSEVRQFLASRRGRLSPAAGGPAGVRQQPAGVRAAPGGSRAACWGQRRLLHPPGTRESERRVGDLLEALVGALQLDEAERTHLFDLARSANVTPSTRRRPSPLRVRPGVQRVLDAMTDAPAWVRNGRSDVLATNRLGRALYAPVFDDPVRPANTARFAFLSDRGREFYRDWDRTANDLVGVLRAEAGRNPYDRGLTELIGELSTRSGDFRTRWAARAGMRSSCSPAGRPRSTGRSRRRGARPGALVTKQSWKFRRPRSEHA